MITSLAETGFRRAGIGLAVLGMLAVMQPALCRNETAVYPVRNGANSLSLNGVWKFKYLPGLDMANDSLFYKPDFNIASWDSILTPGNWDMQGFGQSTYQGICAGTGWYRTEFRLPAEWQNRQIFLLFDGVLFTAEVYMNGHYAGYWASAYNPVTFDVTGLVRQDSVNILAVKVTSGGKGSAFDLNDAWAFYGIFRDVTLFSASGTHLIDYTLTTKLNQQRAEVKVSVVVACPGELKKLAVNGVLLADNERSGQSFSIPVTRTRGRILGKSHFVVPQPLLWTAETPNLYTLRLELCYNGQVEQMVCDRVGLREVSIRDRQLLLNGTAIKLRGIDIHQTSPDRGNAFTEEYLRRDFDLLKKANINFLRTSHYPPPPRFTQLCDSMGFYVMEEVPFGDGDIHLNDSSYQTLLYQRASATVTRDKNRPSVIVWSLGNENPITPLTDNTARFVKQLDPSRPVCYPQTSEYFRENHQRIPAFVDIYAPHYPVPETLSRYSAELDRPVIVTEYAHALGLDMDMMQNLWEIMYAGKIVAGGAVWDYVDQGILRKAPFPVDKSKPTPYVWLDACHYYDSYTSKGTDGILYADRTPQPDYYQVKNVYAPVRVLIDTLVIAGGEQRIELPIENRYDFLNLSAIRVVSGLHLNRQLLQEEELHLDIAARATGRAFLTIRLPQDAKKGYYFLKLNFYDRSGLHIYEKVVRILLPGTTIDWIAQMGAPVTIKTENSDMQTTVSTESGSWNFDKVAGSFSLSSIPDRQNLIRRGMLLRVGRKPTLAAQSVLDRRPVENADYLWTPHVLDQPQRSSCQTRIFADSVVLIQQLAYERGNKSGQFVEGTIRYALDCRGWMHIQYHFRPRNGTGVLLEAGVSFVVAKELTQMRWIGLGPFPSFPDKDALDQFGIYQLANADLYFQGNRGCVQTAIFSDRTGKGLMLVCRDGDVAVENVSDGIMISHNALVSSRFNKFVKPLHGVRAADTREFGGRFAIRLIREQDWRDLLQEVFGNPLHNVEPFCPFYHSYDQ